MTSNKNTKRPIILAKSAMILHQMQNKMNLGADALELQLLGEFVTDGTFNPPSLAEALPQLDEMLKIPAFSIHCPLCAYADNVKFEVPPNLEVYMQPTHEPTFDRVCELAELYGKKQDKQVKVIVHTEFDSSRMNGADAYLVGQIFSFINKYLEKYPHIDICIENVTPITFYGNGTMAFRNGCQFEPVELVEAFRQRYQDKANRVFTSLDTSHFEITKWIMNSLNSYDYIVKAVNYEAENYYIKNSGVCGEIHLSRTVGSGVGEDKQGQPFKDNYSDLMAAKSQIKMYKKHGYTCPICLEVTETDYDISDGFKVSLKVVRQAIEEVFGNE